MAGSVNENDETTRWEWLLRGTGLLLVAAGAWRIYEEGAVTQGLSLAIIAICVLLLSALRKLKSFSISISKLLNLQAETREAVREARDMTNELRSLSKILGGEVLKLLVGGGRWGGHGDSREVYDRSESLLDLLKSMGLSDTDLREIQNGVRHWLVIDYCGVVATLADVKRGTESNPVWNEFWKPWNETDKRPPPELLEMWLQENDWLDAEIAEWLKDYRHFCETGEHRRPQCFRDRDEILQRA